MKDKLVQYNKPDVTSGNILYIGDICRLEDIQVSMEPRQRWYLVSKIVNGKRVYSYAPAECFDDWN